MYLQREIKVSLVLIFLSFLPARFLIWHSSLVKIGRRWFICDAIYSNYKHIYIYIYVWACRFFIDSVLECFILTAAQTSKSKQINTEWDALKNAKSQVVCRANFQSVLRTRDSPIKNEQEQLLRAHPRSGRYPANDRHNQSLRYPRKRRGVPKSRRTITYYRDHRRSPRTSDLLRRLLSPWNTR